MNGQLDLMRRACGELEGCDDFVTLLQEVLQTGNRLNEGTMRGSAAGASISRQLTSRLKCSHEALPRSTTHASDMHMRVSSWSFAGPVVRGVLSFLLHHEDRVSSWTRC